MTADHNALDEFILPRSGTAPLRFRGDLLAESDGQRRGGKEHSRWHELSVYRTAAGRYVIHIAYRTRYQGEERWDHADATDEPAALAGMFTAYDPTSRVVGYPVGPAYEERQRRLLFDIRARYEAQVAEVLAGPVFAHEVE